MTNKKQYLADGIILQPGEVYYAKIGESIRQVPLWFLTTCQGGRQVSRAECLVPDNTNDKGGVKA